MGHYDELPGGWKLGRLRVGCTIAAPDGREVYFQPGDDSAEIINQWDAICTDIPESRQAIMCEISFSDYFPGCLSGYNPQTRSYTL